MTSQAARRGLRLMAIVAHPDDESLGLGGLFAWAAAEGVDTSVVTATRGQSGRYLEHRAGPEHPGPERLGEIREAELRAAAEVLGIRDVSLLDYHDGRLDQVDAREAVDRIVEHVRRVRPHVVVTFPPDGAYGHPDHIAISQLAAAAMVVAADAKHPSALAPHAVSKFYYFVSSPAEWVAYQEAFKKLVSTVDGVERQAVPWPDWEITTIIDTRQHWSTVWRAVSCHHSQIASYEKLKNLPPEHHEALWGRRSLYRAYSLVNGGRKLETDLFEGIEGADPARREEPSAR